MFVMNPSSQRTPLGSICSACSRQLDKSAGSISSSLKTTLFIPKLKQGAAAIDNLCKVQPVPYYSPCRGRFVCGLDGIPHS